MAVSKSLENSKTRVLYVKVWQLGANFFFGASCGESTIHNKRRARITTSKLSTRM